MWETQLLEIFNKHERVLLGIDVSTSINPKVVQSVVDFLIQNHFENTPVVQTDVGISAIMLAKNHNRIQSSGRGGTSYKPLFKLAQQENADAIVYLTDMYGEFPDSESVNTYWLPTANIHNKETPFGKILDAAI